MPQFTLADLESQVYDQLDNNTDFYVQAEVDRAINEAVRTLNLFTGFLQTTSTITGGTQAGRVFYDTPGNILFPIGVRFNTRPLKKSSLRSIGSMHRNWMTHTTVNFGPVADWIPVGTRKFALHPSDSVGSVTLQVIGVQEPTALASATDTVSVPDEHVDTLVNLASHILQLKEGGKIFADASQAYQDFLHGMKTMGRWQKLKQPRYWVEVEAQKKG